MDQDARQTRLRFWTASRFPRTINSTFAMPWRGQIERSKRRERRSSTRLPRRGAISSWKTSRLLGAKVSSGSCFKSLVTSKMSDLKKGSRATSLHLCATSPLIQPPTPSRAYTAQCMKESHSSSTSMRSRKSGRFRSRRPSTSLTSRSIKPSIELVQEASELTTSPTIPTWPIFSSSFLR